MISFPAMRTLTILAGATVFVGALGTRPVADSDAAGNDDDSTTVKVTGDRSLAETHNDGLHPAEHRDR
jgi:hypothetical protein